MRAFVSRCTCIFRHNYTQPLICFSTEELCALAIDLEIEYCTSFFRQQKVNGLEIMLSTKEEFVSRVKTATGGIFTYINLRATFLLQLLMHPSRAGVANAKALKAWTLLQPLLSSSESPDNTNKHVSPL